MNKTFKLVVMQSLLLFVVLSAAMFFMVGITMHMHEAGILGRNVPGFLIATAVTSVLAGMGLGTWLGSLVLAPVERISEASKRIAQGDFDIELPHGFQAREISELSQNFNTMARELSRTEMLRSDFIANVSHEFKTPLASIEGYASLMMDPDLSPEKRAAYAEKVAASAHRLSVLTEQTLLLSQLDNRDDLPEREAFSLDESLRRMVLAHELEWSDRNIEIDVDLAEVQIRAERNLLSLIWENLMTNALKHTPDGGRIGVSLHEEGGNAVVSIEDSGEGMPPEVLERVFERFYQGDSSRSKEGVGLGLSIAKRTAKLHGGSISAKSEPGRGTTFTVVLPLEP